MKRPGRLAVSSLQACQPSLLEQTQSYGQKRARGLGQIQAHYAYAIV